MAEWAIIFDVDGVLLELTRAEEDLFFEPFAKRIDASTLSRDWNSYRIRNDEDIVNEIVERHALAPAEAKLIIAEYLQLLRHKISTGDVPTITIPGAADTLAQFFPRATLGIATANFRDAAQQRLTKADLWHYVDAHAFGADGGGHKHEILARAIAALPLPKSRIIYVGDNVNDVVAGLRNDVHFVGFAQSLERRQHLVAAGAPLVTGDHFKLAEIFQKIMKA